MKRRVKTVEQLSKLALERRAVHIPNGRWSHKHMPAAFMIGLQANYLLSLIKQGMFIYEAKK